MHLIFLIVLWILAGIVGLVVLGGCSLWFLIAFEKPLEALGIRLNPCCLNCGGRSLKKYDLADFFRGAEKLPYYSCDRCMANFKRLKSGELMGLGIGAANDEERDKLFSRPTNLMGYSKENSTGDPLGSWFASVQVGLPGESWPEHGGIPMLPLCQIRYDELPNRPAALNGIAMVCVFVSYVGEEAVSEQGERWVLRTYASLEGLVPLIYPGDATRIHAFSASWRAAKDYLPNQYDAPEAHWIDLRKYSGSGHLSYGTDFSKVGGYGWDWTDREPSLNQLAADFVFQIRVQGHFPWLRGPGGTFSFARSQAANTDLWFMRCDLPVLFDYSLGIPLTLGPDWYFVVRPDGSRTWRTHGLRARIVLEPTECFQPGSEPAQVEAVADGFRIVRWTCTHRDLRYKSHLDCLDQATYQKIEEIVKTNGAYGRTVLLERARRSDDLLLPASGPGETNPDELLRPEP